MAVFFEFQRLRPAVLDGVAQPVQRTYAGIAAPREDEFARAPHADELVVDQVGRHTDQRKAAPALPDDLMAGGEGDQVREPFQGHGVAVVHVLRDRVGKCKEAWHVG